MIINYFSKKNRGSSQSTSFWFGCVIIFLMMFCIGNLQSQTTYSFVTAGATGSAGPTQAQTNAAYLATNLNGSVITTGGIQSFTIPATGNYQIIAAGAGGGNANAFGGRGRIVQGEITLAAGTVLRILVGQKGILTTSSGGGGGSYVSNAAGNATIIVGGGGAGFVGALGVAIPSSDGNILTAGFNSNSGGLGGINGNGGNGSTGWGGGGGGYNTNGTNATACLNTGGQAFLNGGLGGNTCNNTVGGFGGGGGTHGNTGGGGGGGGFSGGGGSDQNIATAVGGGGGSFFAAVMTNTSNPGYNLNQGYVTITQMCVPGACAGTPTAGITQASPTTNCTSYTTALSLSGNVISCSGLTYQWQAAPALAGPWTAIPGATLLTAAGNCTTVSTFFRCLLSCGASTAASTPVQCVVPACVGTPTPGASAASPSIGCATYTTNLTLTGNVVTCGLTYQWQSAPALAGPYTNIVGAISVSANVSNTVNSFYRCVLTCAGTTMASTPAQANNVPCSCAGGNYTFTTAGATGMTGPTQAQINTAYALTNLNGLVVATGGIQSWTVPVTGVYQIQAAGAGGGNANGFGGRGRIVQGDINLAAGTVLRILVGQKGILTTASGGGGGSYVVNTAGNSTIIVGGGGAGFVGALGAAIPSSDANLGTAGNNANDMGGGGGVGGVNGNGGTGANGGWGGGGGGFNADGTDATACLNTRGISFLNGGSGGNTCSNTQGGFGGGGGTHGNTGGGGGGGGFSGGGGSTQNLGNSVGGGGGSFFAAAMTNTSSPGFNLNAGYVIITKPFLPPCAGTPTAGTAVANPTTGCTSYTSALSLTGAVAQCSMTYQWESAPALAGPYTAIPGATIATANVTNVATTFYRCVLVCGGSSATSTPATCTVTSCAGTPTAGNTVASPTTGCSAFISTVSISGNVIACGLTYQWQSSTVLAGPYTNIGGATSITAAVSGSVTTYFRCLISCGASTAVSSPATITVTPGPCATGVWYINSNSGQPWGSTSNITSMNSVFSNTWTQGYFQTVNPAAAFNQTVCFVFLEGGDGNALAMNTFVTTNIVAMQNWVAAGGRLLMNAAPNQGGNMNWGFGGILLNYAGGPLSANGYAAPGQAGHPIFNTPFLPAGTGTYTGNWWCHGYVNGGGVTNVVIGTTPGASLAELAWGAGRVMAGSMTTWNWHLPAPNSQNFMNNLLHYLGDCQVIILPSELINFDLNYDGEVCNLKWKTSSEKNTDYFVIEKSLDGSNYTVLDKLSAGGNSNQTIEYSTNDREPNKKGLTYYRLKQFDRGSTESKINLVKTLNLNEIKKDYLKVQPNPANASVDVFLPEAFINGNKTLNVFDLSGSKVLSLQLGNTTSQTYYQLNIETLKTGMYSLQVVNEEGSSVKTTFIKN